MKWLKMLKRQKLPYLHVRYRKTPRTAASGKVFDDFEFDVLSEEEGVTTSSIPHTRIIPDDSLIEVIVEGTR